MSLLAFSALIADKLVQCIILEQVQMDMSCWPRSRSFETFCARGLPETFTVSVSPESRSLGFAPMGVTSFYLNIRNSTNLVTRLNTTTLLLGSAKLQSHFHTTSSLSRITPAAWDAPAWYFSLPEGVYELLAQYHGHGAFLPKNGTMKWQIEANCGADTPLCEGEY